MIAEFWSKDGKLQERLALSKNFLSISERQDDSDYAVAGLGGQTLFLKHDPSGAVILLKEKAGQREEIRLRQESEYDFGQVKLCVRDEREVNGATVASSVEADASASMHERLLSIAAVPMHDRYALQTALQGFVEAIVETAPAQSGLVLLFDRSGPEIVGSVGISREDAMRLIQKIPEGIVREILKNEARMIVPEHLGTKIHDDKTIFVHGVESVAGFPVVAEGKVLAIFYLTFGNLVKELSSQLQRTLEGAASLVGLVIQRAQLREQVNLSNVDSSKDDLIPSRKMIGRSVAMDHLYQMLRKLAPSRVPVYIYGETGTGKELAARELHRLSGRSAKPFVAINAAALPETLIESELFGHKKGAFTGALSDRMGLIEQANGGTLFIDEIGELPLNLQSKLLRVLQEKTVTRLGENSARPVDFRLVTATHCDVRSMVQNKTFREDLYYRIAGAEIQMPPLRKRSEDVILLAQFFMKRFCEQQNLSPRDFSEPAKKALLFYEWPGNVRELEHAVERGIIMSEGDVIQVSDLGMQSNTRESSNVDSRDLQENLELAYHTWLKRHLLLVLEKYDGNKTKAASALGVGLRTLFRYIEQLNIKAEKD